MPDAESLMGPAVPGESALKYFMRMYGREAFGIVALIMIIGTLVTVYKVVGPDVARAAEGNVKIAEANAKASLALVQVGDTLVGGIKAAQDLTASQRELSAAQTLATQEIKRALDELKKRSP